MLPKLHAITTNKGGFNILKPEELKVFKIIRDMKYYVSEQRRDQQREHMPITHTEFWISPQG